jgi:RIO-like serine/threonine protein kinase
MKVSEREYKILEVLANAGGREDFGYLSFAGIAKRSKLDQSIIRRTVRALARKKLAEYGRGLWSDGGEPRGSGYCATSDGIDFFNAQARQ